MTRVRIALIGCAFLAAACGDRTTASEPPPPTETISTTTTTEQQPTTTTTTTTKKKSSKSGGGDTTTKKSTTTRRSSSSGGTKTLDCADLSGDGTLGDPLVIGAVDRKVVVEDCDPLTSGTAYNHRYFTFTLPGKPASGAKTGARFTLSKDGSSAVNPRLVKGSVTIKHSGEGHWTGESPHFTGRYLTIDDIGAGTYTLGFEKLRSPLSGSLSTPPFDVYVDPGD